MKSLHPFSNHVSGLATETIEAGTHRLGIKTSRWGREWNTSSVPTKGLTSNPSSLSACGSDPYSRFAPTMDDCESPFCLEVSHFTVRNHNSAHWIDNFDRIFAKDKFGSNPNHVSENSQSDADDQFNGSLHETGDDQEAIGGEEKNQNKRNPSPHVIAFGTEDLVHKPSIAGERK